MFEESRDPRKWEPVDERRVPFCRGGQTDCLLFAFHMALQIYKSLCLRLPLWTLKVSPPCRMNGGRSGTSWGGENTSILLSSPHTPSFSRSDRSISVANGSPALEARRWADGPHRRGFCSLEGGQVRASLDSFAMTCLNWPFFIPRQQCPI